MIPLFCVNPIVTFIAPLHSCSPLLYPHQVGQLMWDSKTTPSHFHTPLGGAASELRT